MKLKVVNVFLSLTVFFSLLLPELAWSAADAHGDAPHLDGGTLSALWVIPFVGMLLSIALGPLLVPHFWEHNFGKISLGWGLLFFVPFTATFGLDLAIYEAAHTAFLEYIPFIVLLLSLFTITGGIRVETPMEGTPAFNTAVLALGTFLASWMGTTGAAMILIRPLIRALAVRRHKVHVIVFFIFLVANIGGSLTPLGDPPLFLGFLKGVPFFWPTVHMLVPMLILSAILLVVFFIMDSLLYRRENADKPARMDTSLGRSEIKVTGKINLLLLLGVIGAVLMSGVWKPGISFEIYHVPVELQNIARDVILLSLAVLSLVLTKREVREGNEFGWFPIVEVAKLFAGIFATIIPALAILKAGTEGALGAVIKSVSTESGEPINMMYFWATGILSSFLDNAPTYLVFFNTAGGDPAVLTGELTNTLLAISAGAVFMGANTYIGNAPNFMVRAIAEERGIKMPSFFGYMIWSVIILIPCFVLIGWLFF